MWVAGWLRRTEEPQETTNAESGTVTIGGSTAGVLSRGEERNVPLASPGGYAWRPKNGERVLVIKGGTLGEERYVAGSLDAAREQDDLDDARCASTRRTAARASRCGETAMWRSREISLSTAQCMCRL